jgi:hypothetical protein
MDCLIFLLLGSMKAYKTSAGNWQLNYTLEGKQRTLSLGRGYTAIAAERTAKIVTELVSLRKMGETLPLDLVQRVGTLPVRVRLGLERGGLADGDRIFSPQQNDDVLLLELLPRLREYLESRKDGSSNQR